MLCVSLQCKGGSGSKTGGFLWPAFWGQCANMAQPGQPAMNTEWLDVITVGVSVGKGLGTGSKRVKQCACVPINGSIDSIKGSKKSRLREKGPGARSLRCWHLHLQCFIRHKAHVLYCASQCDFHSHVSGNCYKSLLFCLYFLKNVLYFCHSKYDNLWQKWHTQPSCLPEYLFQVSFGSTFQ